jgi:hypothetical protein
MIEQILKTEMERRKMFLEFVIKTFSGAVVEEIPITQMNKPDGWGIAIRLKEPNSPSIILRPRRSLMTHSNVDFLPVFLAGIQEAKGILNNPAIKEQDFQGTIILNEKGVEKFQRGEDQEEI